MNAPHASSGARLTVRLSSFITLVLVAACATSGQPPTARDGAAPQPAAAPAQSAAPRGANASVLTALEIATAPGIMNALDAVQSFRPQFLRTRGPVGRPGGVAVPGSEGRVGGRRGGQSQGSPPPGGSDQGGRGDNSSAAGRPAEDPGVVVYVDRQRYGAVQTLREIPVAAVDEIRFHNVGDANSLFGMGHPHGVIQVITKRRAAPQ